MSCRLRDDKVNDLKVKSLLSFTELSSFMIQTFLNNHCCCLLIVFMIRKLIH